MILIDTDEHKDTLRSTLREMVQAMAALPVIIPAVCTGKIKFKRTRDCCAGSEGSR